MKTKTTRWSLTPVPVRRGFLVALMLSGSGAFAQTITITNLVIPGAASLSVAGLNATGQVAGYFYTAASAQRAFLWTDGTSSDLGTLGGGAAVANGLNNFNQVEIVQTIGQIGRAHV